jgi:hypothetical protein
MTEVAITLRSAYLAGPMRGYDHYNFPEFHKQAAWLRDNGWLIFSPAERDEADPDIDHQEDIAGWTGTRGLDYFMAFDLKAVCETDAVILMKGWQESQGARLEAMVAVEIDHPVFEIVRRDTGRFRRRLESVDPTRVSAEFIAGTRANDFLATVEAFEPVTIETEESQFSTLTGRVARAMSRGNPFSNDPEPWLEDPPFAENWDVDQVTGATALPTDSAGRKAVPITSGVLDYFPAALVEVARVSKAGNDKHNPGEPLHHARGKSTDHADSLLRHLIDRGKIDAETGMRHSAEVAWRALALLQQELEDEGLAPLPRGARLDGQSEVDKIIARMGGERD